MRFSTVTRGAIGAVKAYFLKEFSFENFTNTDFIFSFIRLHLRRVYVTLFLILGSSSLGFSLNILGEIGGLTTVISFVGSLILFCSIRPWKEKKRASLLVAAAFFNGASTEYLIGLFITIDQGIVVTVLVGTAVAFGCFALAAIRQQDRIYMYYYGVLYSAILIPLWMLLASFIFGDNSVLFYFLLYFGYLMCFLPYVVAYSQELVVQARGGNLDYSLHSITLFTDIPPLCIRYGFAMLKKPFVQNRR